MAKVCSTIRGRGPRAQGEVRLKSIALLAGRAGSAGKALVLPALVIAALPLAQARAQTVEELREMSIEDLAQVNVTSVSKTDQPIGDAPASIYVITREDIIRSGAATLPEMLRLAPNLEVFQTAPATWVVTSRGLSGNPDAQNFSNKLLVLVDGRTVYTPLYSGVYWDMPDILPDNIDRIEVISGPGATLWGANAVNGVINVITRQASEVDGVYADVRAGPDRQVAGVRLAGTAGDRLSYRIHARGLREDEAFTAAGTRAGDDWWRLGGGFRVDWTPSDADRVSMLGEIFDGHLDAPGTGYEEISGRSLSLRWARQMANAGELQFQVFYDRIGRDSRSKNAGNFHSDTFDAELQHSFEAGLHRIVWGGGARLVDYAIGNIPSFFFEPAENELFIANAFAQDSFAVSDDLTLTAGLKIEHLPDAGASLLPEARIAWKPAPTTLIWGAVSRAVRSPTPFDTDVEERVDFLSLSGNPDFRTEKLTAFELGTRVQPARTFSFSATAFYHRYDDLRTIEPGTGQALLNLTWANGLKGSTYGLEAWANWRTTPWWTLTAGGTLLERDFEFKPGASGLLGVAQLGSDPPYTLTLLSSMNLPHDVTLDLNFRAIGALSQSNVSAYQELGGRLAWRASPNVTLSVSGTNLLHEKHLEYRGGDLIPRRVMGGVELRF
jgi:iron complex outermembrane receptor protein